MIKKVIYKYYDQNQQSLLPLNLQDLISATHPVRVVNAVVEQLDLKSIEKKYKGGGTSSYHPKMLLKVIIYSYLNNIYSSRKMELALQENIHFMWLSGMSYPDHNTINRFRGVRLSTDIKSIFTQVVLLLADSGHVDLREAYTDGTKIEANANRYSFVWGKNIKNNRAKIEQQLKELWEYAQKVSEAENDDDTPTDFSPTDSKKVQATIDKINETLKNKEINVDKKIQNKLKYAQDNWPKKIDQYNEQEKLLAGRNSYSKIDTDATFMRMKEDHMKNGQLKPAYNLQISTNQQIITNYSIHQNPTDTKTFIAHLEEYQQYYPNQLETSIADAGYGSEQNYEYLSTNEINNYVKYNYFDKEQKKTRKDKNPFTTDKLYYNKEQNYYICPMGQQMHHIGSYQQKTEAGYTRKLDRYQAQNCNNCPLRGICHQAQTNRIIETSHKGNELKKQAKENLESEQGRYYRKKRCIEPEPVFANLKHNKKFKRYMLRGLEKVSIETGLLAIAHNLSKIAA